MHIRITKGFDIRLQGAAQKKLAACAQPETFAIKPTDFINITRPKLLVKEGDNVRAGSPLFFDKQQEDVLYTSPVSGEVVDFVRGKKRRLLEVVILADKEVDYFPFPKYREEALSTLSREKIIESLCKSGIWPQFIQRPYGIVARSEHMPKAIFVSACDTHPLAPDDVFLLEGQEHAFQAGITILQQLSGTKVHLCLPAHRDTGYFAHIKGVEQHTVEGPHPSGNVGVHIHHIDPVHHKEKPVWTIHPYGVVQIGKFFLEGHYDASKRVALTGSEIKSPQYYTTYTGASIHKMLLNNLQQTHVRYISGNVLTGEKIKPNGHMGYYHHQVTVIEEGDKAELFGWIKMSANKLSFHRALCLISYLFPSKKHVMDTNMHGEARAFVQTGAFEKVLPMDILPTHLIKAILAQDYEGMEALGIYELIEEDVALCEFIDVSKHHVQAIIREGITLMMED